MFWLLAVTVLDAAYVAAAPSATVFYIANVLLHLVLGATSVAWLGYTYRRHARVVPLVLAGVLGVYLIFAGATTDHRAILLAHIALAVIGLALLMPRWTAPLAALAVLALAIRFGPRPEHIRNPNMTPVSMNEEGGGPRSPFFPSSAKTNVGGIIPSNFFMDSEACGRCHKDIYRAVEKLDAPLRHRSTTSSTGNPSNTCRAWPAREPSKWCAGCHDHAVFFNGRFDRPIKDQIDTPEAQAGLGCMSCHAIVHVASTMGNGDFTVRVSAAASTSRPATIR